MMLVRAPQLEAFRVAAELQFIDEMTAYLRRFSPPLYRTLGDERAEEVVRRGVARAVEFGFTKRGPVRLFLELEWIFGTGFDTDPQIPWAGEVLSDPTIEDEMYRAGRLEQLCIRFLDEVHGPEGRHADEALRRLEADARGWLFHEGSWRAEVEVALRAAFARKAEYIGARAISEILDLAELRAKELFGPDELRGRCVLAILMFSFGSGCLEDPLYPWIGATASNARVKDARRRAKALERKSILWVKAVNAHRQGAAS